MTRHTENLALLQSCRIRKLIIPFAIFGICIFADAKDHLRRGEKLQYGDCLISENRAFTLAITEAGHLGIFDIADTPRGFSRIVWNPKNWPSAPGGYFIFHTDNDLALCDGQGNTVWSSNTKNTATSETILYLDNNGRISLMTETERIWCSCPYCSDAGFIRGREHLINHLKRTTNMPTHEDEFMEAAFPTREMKLPIFANIVKAALSEMK